MAEQAAVQVVRNEFEERFEARRAGELLGVATYRTSPGHLEIVHTVVERAHRGQGIGEQLAEAALDAARADGLAVIPTCPFIRRYVDEHPEHAPLLAS